MKGAPGVRAGKAHRSNRGARPFFLLILAAVAAPLCLAQQSAPTERVYEHPQIEIEKALEQLKAYSTERLPTLDGFANANAVSLDHLQNPHFQLHIDLISQGSSQTVVRVSAKITAWNEALDPSHSQYAVVPSNGRLEEDFLDRLSVYLEKASGRPVPQRRAGAPGSAISAPSSSPVAAADDDHSATSSPSAHTAGVPAAGTSAAALASQIAAARSERESVELSERKLQQQISEMESLSKSQVYVKNLAIIRGPQAAVFEKDQEISKVLFRAAADDEFTILETRGPWVGIALEKGEGWLQASQLQRPGEASDPDDAAAANFSAANEEVKPFEGDWTQLKGKRTLFVFAQPARQIPEATLGQNQLEYAKHVFLDGYRQATHSGQELAGVVVVFLGAKGGVAAATLADIRRWHEGNLTDKIFISRCSLDPTESFRDKTSR